MLLIRNRGFNRSYVTTEDRVFSAPSLMPLLVFLVKKQSSKRRLNSLKKLLQKLVKSWGEKGVQKVSSLISPRLTSKSEDILMKHMKLPPGPLDREHSPFRTYFEISEHITKIYSSFGRA